MRDEIERRFLVADPAVVEGRRGTRLVQGYLCRGGERTVRLRLAVAPDGRERAWLTVKGPSRLVDGALVRPEWEVELPPAEAREGLALCPPHLVEKTRHRLDHAGRSWELDVFHGENEGLAIAEIELGAPGEEFDPPPWLGREISAEPGLGNAALAERPWSSRSARERALA
ncbi:MAG: CYTH domain-containing protein [bacterium]|jgi:adenylate cyclase|nr:CYTH domain-containing protein [bacterium]